MVTVNFSKLLLPSMITRQCQHAFKMKWNVLNLVIFKIHFYIKQHANYSKQMKT